MLHIVWLILKIAGMILAGILLLLLLIIFLLLFVPVRYRITADRKTGELEPFRVQVKVTWLLHMVNVMFSFQKELYLRIRIFVFTIFRLPAEEVKKEKHLHFGRKKPVKENAQDAAEKAAPEQKEDKENKSEVKEDTEENAKEKTQTEETDETEKPEAPGKIKRLWEKIKEISAKIWDAILNIQYTIKAICDKIKNIIANIQYYLDILQSDVFKASFAVSKKQLYRIFKSIRPAKCSINLLAGTGDPASTGQILAVYGILYPLIGNNVSVEADFGEQAILEGSLYMKGKITVFTLVMAGIRIYRDKNIRQLIKMFKREEA